MNQQDCSMPLRIQNMTPHFETLYGKREGRAIYEMDRYSRIEQRHLELYGEKEIHFFSAPGRTEIGGNHTDHNNGCVLAAAIDLDAIAAVSPNDDQIVRLYSHGYGQVQVDLSTLEPLAEEIGTTKALIRGCAALLKQKGLEIGGFDATVTSDVLSGSGLSSSACFENLILSIFDGLYNGWQIAPVDRAKWAQIVENQYFGKPCGLMDQMACSLGGLVSIDFRAQPKVKQLSFDFESHGYAMMVVDVGSSHDDLTDEYASIPKEMKQVAELLGGHVLRDILPEQLDENVAMLHGKVSDRAILRAYHYFDENERVHQMVQALESNDIARFMQLIRASGESSWKLLQNIYVPTHEEQGMALALELTARILGNDGAWRVHGGGFAGTILVFLPLDTVERYTKRMQSVFGEKSCTRIGIRPVGATPVSI